MSHTAFTSHYIYI